MSASIEDLLRELAPQVLGILARRNERFDLCEDAVQEALLAAATNWPVEGLPDNPRGWLITVASRRLTDLWRSENARREREVKAFRLSLGEVTSGELSFGGVGAEPAAVPAEDDTLTLLFLCCHPALSASSQLALTLRAVGGLTTAQVAHAFLVPESTMAQRISRAKDKIRSTGTTFAMPPEEERDERLQVVLQVLYLIFNEGYTASSGPDLHRVELSAEAIRLTRAVRRLLPDDGEVAGLLALMLLTDAHRPARTGPDGSLIPLAEQDRSLWDAAAVAEGTELIEATMRTAPLGPYQLQAAIVAVHNEAVRAEDTDWAQIAVLYQVLERISPNPMITLNRAIAVAMVDGPDAGLALLEPLGADRRMAGHHRLHAVRAHLRELAGELDAARAGYLEAARRTTSQPEQRYLTARASRLSVASG
ncbi:RNA polymerase sigma factor [Kribbella deserti]|uniref:RNA polymerase sigma factor n=1 Tax=Kribbella deserti TaxID=1926257 RepID=A0ABV6QJ37_9ACTN